MSDPNKYFWSEEEIAKLRELYPTIPNKEIAKILGRTELAVKAMAIRLGLKKDPNYLVNLPTRIKKGQHLSPETEFKKGHVPPFKGKRLPEALRRRLAQVGFFPKRGEHRSPQTEFKKGHRPWNKVKDIYGFSIRDLKDEHLLANYIIDNPKEFGYVKVYLCPASNFDLLGIKEDGSVERVELEHGLSDFLYHHDPSECDRVIAIYNTKKPFPLPYIIVDRRRFAEYVKKLIDETRGLIY